MRKRTSRAGADRIVDSISIDSRTLTAGALFVALKGEQVDGHDFAAAAAARGAAALLVERDLPIGRRRLSSRTRSAL